MEATRYSVPSIDRALRVLELLAESKRGFSSSEIGRQLNLPKSSIHLVVTTLERRGYLCKNQLTGRFCLGLKLVSLSRTALENLDMREQATPFLRSLMQKTALTVHMAILERDEVVIIEKIEAPGLLRLATWIGRRLDINCSGVGKALIAFLPEVDFEERCKVKVLARHNENTIVSLGKLKRELAAVRAQGYAFDDEEDELGFRCIGVPIFASNQRAIAAISVAGATAQIPDERIHQLAATVQQMARRISLHLSPMDEDTAAHPMTRA